MAVDRSDRREFRRVVGPALADTVLTHSAKLAPLWSLYRRGFWGRMRWILFGK